MMNETKKPQVSIRTMSRVALLGAIGILLMYFIAFPLPFFPDFLTYDAGDIPGILASFSMGPWYGVLVQGIKALVGLAVGASKAGPIGAFANFLAGASYAIVAGYYYRLHRTMKGAVIGMVLGSLATAVVMSIANYFVLLPFWGIPTEQIGGLIVAAIFPFNLVKTALSSFVSFLLYKKVKGFIEVR